MTPASDQNDSLGKRIRLTPDPARFQQLLFLVLGGSVLTLHAFQSFGRTDANWWSTALCSFIFIAWFSFRRLSFTTDLLSFILVAVFWLLAVCPIESSAFVNLVLLFGILANLEFFLTCRQGSLALLLKATTLIMLIRLFLTPLIDPHLDLRHENVIGLLERGIRLSHAAFVMWCVAIALRREGLTDKLAALTVPSLFVVAIVYYLWYHLHLFYFVQLDIPLSLRAIYPFQVDTLLVILCALLALLLGHLPIRSIRSLVLLGLAVCIALAVGAFVLWPPHHTLMEAQRAAAAFQWLPWLFKEAPILGLGPQWMRLVQAARGYDDVTYGFIYPFSLLMGFVFYGGIVAAVPVVGIVGLIIRRNLVFRWRRFSATVILIVASYYFLFFGPLLNSAGYVAFGALLTLASSRSSNPLNHSIELRILPVWFRRAAVVGLVLAGFVLVVGIVTSTTHLVRGPRFHPIEKSQKVPVYLVQMLLAQEDTSFFVHPGVNYKEVWVSVKRNIRDLSFTRGASTITMQLAKIQYLSNRKTFLRKLSQTLIATYYELTRTKAEILAEYLAVLDFGLEKPGLAESASQYFNKAPTELTRQEAMSLVLSLPNPKKYPPTNPGIFNQFPRAVYRINKVIHERDLALSSELRKIEWIEWSTLDF